MVIREKHAVRLISSIKIAISMYAMAIAFSVQYTTKQIKLTLSVRSFLFRIMDRDYAHLFFFSFLLFGNKFRKIYLSAI